jgi:hypothetical protein
VLGHGLRDVEALQVGLAGDQAAVPAGMQQVSGRWQRRRDM